MKHCVEILMATYNGESFIKEQLDSLISQSYTNWCLYIHDDGSTDKTIDIVKAYVEADARINLIEDGVILGGAGKNFLHLLSYSKGEFVMFCDQDDIWLENKVEIMLESIERFTSPAMVYSNGYTFNGTDITNKYFVTFHRSTLEDSLFLNGGIHGCCMIFNKSLVGLLQDNLPEYVYMHDHLVTMAAVSFGEIGYVDKPLMLYRQHDNNVTGNVKTTLTSKAKSFLDTSNPVLDKKHYDANISFYNHFENKLTPKQRELFKAYKDFPNKTTFGRVVLVLRYGFKVKSNFLLVVKTLIRKAI